MHFDFSRFLTRAQVEARLQFVNQVSQHYSDMMEGWYCLQCGEYGPESSSTYWDFEKELAAYQQEVIALDVEAQRRFHVADAYIDFNDSNEGLKSRIEWMAEVS